MNEPCESDHTLCGSVDGCGHNISSSFFPCALPLLNKITSPAWKIIHTHHKFKFITNHLNLQSNHIFSTNNRRTLTRNEQYTYRKRLSITVYIRIVPGSIPTQGQLLNPSETRSRYGIFVQRG